MDVTGFENRMDALVNQGRTSRHTRDTYVNAVKRFAEWYHEDHSLQPSAQDVKEYIDHIADQGSSNSSIQTTYYALKRYFKYDDRQSALTDSGVDDHVAENYPVGGGSTPDFLEGDQVKELKEVARDMDERDGAIVYLLTSTGCRVGELVDLDLDDIDTVNREVSIERQKRNETIKDSLPLDDDDVEVIEEYLDVRDAYGDAELDALFITRSGRMSTDTVQHRLKKVADETASIEPEDIHPHLIRHAVGTQLAQQGRTATEIADYLGHASTSTAEKYVHLSSEHREGMRADLL